eukprot:gene7401-8813_t
MDDKLSTFSGNEPRRLELWDSIYESLKYTFTQATDDNTALSFDLVDTSGEVNEVYNDVLYEALGHVSDLMEIKFPADVYPEPLILDYYNALAKVPAALGAALPPQKAKRQLLAMLDKEFY